MKKGLRANYIYSIVITALALFMMGLMALIFVEGTELSNDFKENMEYTVILKDGISDQTANNFRDFLSGQPYVKKAEYISKDDAVKIFIRENNEDFTNLLDFNPLFASINLQLNSSYTSADSVLAIQKTITARPEVSEFYYEKNLSNALNAHLEKVSWILLGFTVLLLIISVTLLDGAARLSMYSQRFLIRSMQLVGATKRFIIRPFVARSLWHGFLSSLMAVAFLFALLNFVIYRIPAFATLQDWNTVLVIFSGMVICGIFFSCLSTRFAVGKYLHMKLDDLY
jgi:cell division transport system permease protein